MDQISHRFLKETVNFELVNGQRLTGYVTAVSEDLVELVLPNTTQPIWVLPLSSIVGLNYIPSEQSSPAGD